MIEVRGPNVFREYWRNPQKTAAEVRSDGFFVTGDIGRIDAHGCVHIALWRSRRKHDPAPPGVIQFPRL